MMKIVVIGAGAMGSIYGGRLSLHNEVFIIDLNQQVVNAINDNGLKIEEGEVTNCYTPTAVLSSDEIGEADLVILFVKSVFSRDALENNRGVIGPQTRLMTLQNGAGHEDLLQEFVSREHIIIGTTEDNGSVLLPGRVRRGGAGNTNLGVLPGVDITYLETIKDTFDRCGFTVHIHEDIHRLIWDKLFINASLSVLTGILQVDMGYIASDMYTWELTELLISEAVQVANSLGLSFEMDQVLKKVCSTSVSNPRGCTSIRADLRDGRKTEVDSISGAIVKAAKYCGVKTPTHEYMVKMVHAMEGRLQNLY